jgi:uncharacterized protein with HEPN domain
MQEQTAAWLEDIAQAIAEINVFIPIKYGFVQYQADLKTKRAVERNIEIIGEALARILKEIPDIAISNSRKIVDTRNRIIHGYDSVSDDIIWLIVRKYLPILDVEVRQLLG